MRVPVFTHPHENPWRVAVYIAALILGILTTIVARPAGLWIALPMGGVVFFIISLLDPEK